MVIENLSIAQHWDTLQYAHTRGGSFKPKVRQFDVGDFVYLQRQPNDTLDTSSSCTILKIKVIRPLGVLELQGVNGRTIWDHSKNCAPCHLPNLDPTIITLTWSPPLDYPRQVCQRTNDVDHMLLYDNCNGGNHLFCLKLELIQVLASIWYCSSYSPTTPWFLLRPCHDFPNSGLGGGYMKISSPASSYALYIYVRASFFGWLVSTFD
jgi:hypothetical protein